MAATLLLDRATNDLTLDAGRQIAVAADPYATSQTVGCALRLWLGDYYYDTTLGVPYAAILGGGRSVGWIKAQLIKAALTVPGVIKAVCYLQAPANRRATGQVLYTTASGSSGSASF